jgi:hypothetical protein
MIGKVDAAERPQVKPDNVRAPGYVSYDSYRIDAAGGFLSFWYSYNDQHRFEVRLRTELAGAADPEIARDLEAAVFTAGMGLIPMVYLAFCTPEIRVRAGYLDEAQIEFWRWAYEMNMVEHLYAHRTASRSAVELRCEVPRERALAPARARSFERPRVLVPLGGGKDSAVLIELLRGVDADLFTSYFEEYPGEFLNLWRLRGIARVAGFDKVHLSSLDFVSEPELEAVKRFDQATEYSLYPTLYACSGVINCLVHGYSHIAVGNERSANFGNADHLGQLVNQKFQRYCREYLAPHISYFSGLMHLWEIQIAERFARYPKYLPVFLSCNKADESRWCARCPKCAVICLLLSAFVDPSQVIAVYGDDLFEYKRLFPVFDALLGLARPKPLECVCTEEECRALLHLTVKRYEGAGVPLPTYLELRRELAEAPDSRRLAEKLRKDYNPENAIPEPFLPALTAPPA